MRVCPRGRTLLFKKNIMKKNKFYWLAFLFCALTLGLTSCEKEDIDDDEKNLFGTEKYEDISGLYEVENTGSGIESIELTAGGEYIIMFTNDYDNYSPTRIREQKKSIFAFSNVSTRATSGDFITGTYTYDEEEGEIVLEDYGTLLVYHLNEEGTFDAFILSTDDGERIELDVTKQEEMEDSAMTNKLCRTWKPKSDETIFKVTYGDMKNETVLHVKYVFATEELSILDNTIDMSEEDLEDLVVTTLRKVVFSKAGTYMVYHEYDGYEESSMAKWRWNDEKAGYLLYYWDDNQDYEYESEGIVEISFSNTSMSVSENIEIAEDGVSVTMIHKTVLVEAY